MTKADHIRALYAEGRNVREIADELGCSASYVRVAARQRKDGKASAADRNYVPANLDDRAKHAAREAARHAFARARKLGLTVRQSNVVALRARKLSLRIAAKLYRASVQKALTPISESGTNQYSRE